MKPNEGKDVKNSTTISIETSTDSTQKEKSKRKILNPFKKLSLKRTKSSDDKSNVFHSESACVVPKEKSRFASLHGGKHSQSESQNEHVADKQDNIFHSGTSHTISQTVMILSNNATEGSKHFDQKTVNDGRQLNFIFNTADLPSLSSCNKHIAQDPNYFVTNEEEINYVSNIYDPKFRQSQRKRIEKRIKRTVNEICNIVPTNIISDSVSNTKLNNQLFLALKEVLDVANYLQENEIHLKHLISKYIQNEKFQEELVSALSSHSKIQIENERRAHKLAQEMFVHEIETYKAKECALQNSLDVVVQINRLLEEEIETIKTENERIIIEYDNNTAACACHKRYEEDLINNNKDLRARLKHLLGEIKKFENDLKNLQTKNEYLLNQLSNANGQIRNYRDTLQKTVGDNEVEHAALLKQLATNEQVLKASIDAGDTLMEDLESIKRQLKQMPFTFNFTKFKCRGSSVVDLLHLARSCINELSRELLRNYMIINYHNKDNENQNIEISKLNEELHKFKTNDSELHSKFENLSALEKQVQEQLQKISELQSQIELNKKNHFKMAERLFQEKDAVKNLIKENEDIINQLSARDLEISLLNNKIRDIIAENSTLKFQLDSMKKLLDEHKLSNVLSKLLATQEKCVYYQSQFYQLELEKNNLTEMSKKFEIERETLLTYNKACNDHFQVKQKEIADLNKQINELKEQLKNEREHLLEKDSQLIQQIQENKVIKTVQSQLQAELTKSQVLESNTLETNFEVNRLSVVAEYNNMICQQLKNAIQLKDKTISELKLNLQKLNIAEKKSFEDKASLCQEISESSYVIKNLEDKLKKENEKVQFILAEKSILYKDAEVQFGQLQKLLTEERQAARDLINDHKNLTTQRNNLLSQQNEYLTQIEKLKTIENKLKSISEQQETKCLKYENYCNEITKQLHETNKKLELKHQKAKDDVIEYENKLSSRDKIIEKLKYEKDELQNSIQYLQNNINNLQNGLNDLRNTDKENKDKLTSHLKSISEFQQLTVEQQQVVDNYKSEHKILEQKLSEALSNKYDLLSKYNSFIKESQEKEETLLKDIDSYKKLNDIKTKSIDYLAMDMKSKQKVLNQRQEEYNTLKNNLKKFEELQKNFSEKSKLFESSLENQHELNEKILKLASEHERNLKTIKELSNVANLLQTQLDMSTKNREQEIETCQTFLKELTREAKDQKQCMLTDLSILKEKCSDLNSKYNEKCLSYEHLKSNYKELAQELINSVNSSLEDKILKKNKETEVILLNNKVEELTSKLDYVNKYMDEVNEIKSKASSIFEKGDSMQNELEEMKKLYSCVKVDYKILEAKYEDAMENLKHYEQSSFIEELENRAKLIQKAEKNMEILENRVRKLRIHLQTSNKIIIELQSEISSLHQKIQVLEFQKCELTLRYHELNGKYLSERNLNATLKESHQHLLSKVCELHLGEAKTVIASESVLLTLK